MKNLKNYLSEISSTTVYKLQIKVLHFECYLCVTVSENMFKIPKVKVLIIHNVE